MSILKRDNNEQRYNNITQIINFDAGLPDYYERLFSSAKALFYGLNRSDLVDEMNDLIKQKIERRMGAKIGYVLFVYKNLPYLNSFTRSLNKGADTKDIKKFEIKEWLSEVEKWIFINYSSLETEIIFTQSPK